MKRILRHYIIDTTVLYLVSNITSGLVFEKGIETLLLAGVGLMLVSLFAKPVINILLLPINLITFGVFRWVSSVLILYLVTLVVPGFKILDFTSQAFTFSGMTLPAFHFVGIMAYLAFSFLISFIVSLIYWLIK